MAKPANDKGITAVRVILEVAGGDSPSRTQFEIENPSMAVITEMQVNFAELGKQMALKHGK
jgi:hypothetical protein